MDDQVVTCTPDSRGETMARAPKAGWHADPAAPGRERYWDGSGWSGEARDAPPQKRKRRGGTFIKVMLGVIIGGTVLIGGCVALIAGGVDEAQKDSDKTSITAKDYGTAKTGETTKATVVDMFGEPSSADELKADGVKGIPESDFSQSCVYYNRRGELASIFQFCFDGDDKLTSKSSI